MNRKLLKSKSGKEFCLITEDKQKVQVLYYTGNKENQQRYTLKDNTFDDAVKYVRGSDYEEYQEQVSIDEITEIVLDMLSEGKDFEEVKKKTGVLNIEEDKSPDGETTVITIHYPDGETISHWV